MISESGVEDSLNSGTANMQKAIRLFPVVAALVLVAGCATGSRTYALMRLPNSTAISLQSGELTVEEEALMANLCPFGQPELGEFANDEPVSLIVRDGYAMAHNDLTKTPLWVCENVRKEDVHGELTGRGSWVSDEILCGSKSPSKCERGAVDADYAHSGYDRGHLAPNWNQRRDPERKKATFILSNAAPQKGKKFNQSVWQDLERKLTEKVTDLEAFWTITGVIYSEEEEGASSAPDGFLTVETIGNGNVYVPTHFYKIVVWEDGDQPDAFAVVMKIAIMRTTKAIAIQRTYAQFAGSKSSST